MKAHFYTNIVEGGQRSDTVNLTREPSTLVHFFDRE